MPKLDWKELTITPKELLGVLVFVFTMSGVWYKLYYENANLSNELSKLKLDFADYKKSTDNRLKPLEDDLTGRNYIEKAAAATGQYYPMTPVKK